MGGSLGGPFYKSAVLYWGPKGDPNLENYPYSDNLSPQGEVLNTPTAHPTTPL